MADSITQSKAAVNARVAEAKQILQQAKNVSMQEIYSAAQPTPGAVDTAASVAEQMQYTDEGLAPVEQTDGTISKHTDGTFSVDTPQGTKIGGLSEENAAIFSAYTQAERQAAEDNAPIALIDELVNRIGGGAIGVGGTLAQGFTGDQTIEEGANRYNANLVDPFPIDGQALLGEEITQEQIDMYRQVSATGRNQPLSLEERAFTKTGIFSEIAQLDKAAQKGQARSKAVSAAATSLKDYVPVNRRDEAAANAAFDVISKNSGTVDALIDAVTAHPMSYLTQGVDSIPYMVAFTVGGPITQTGVLIGMARGKMTEMTNEFIQKNDKPPTLDEQTRLEAWAAVATVAEKFGDMAAVKAIPIARWGRVQKVASSMQKAMPSSLKKFIVAPAVGLAGEGLSGGITEIAEQVGLGGEVDKWSDVAKAAFAEAMGTPGGIGGMVAGRLAFKAAKGAVSVTKDVLTAEPEVAAEETAPVAAAEPVTEEVAPAPEVELLETPIEQEEFDAAVTQSTTADTAEAIVGLLTLGKRELTDEQADQHTAAIKALKERVTKAPVTADTEMGSLKDVMDITPEELNKVLGREDTSAADRSYAEAVLEAQQMEADLEAKSPPKTAAEVHKEVTEGVTDNWTGFKEYVNQITAILEDPDETDPVIRDAKVASLESQMQVHAANIQSKLDAFNEALATTPANPEEVMVVRGDRVEPRTQNRLMDYTVESIPRTEYTAERAAGKYINLIDAKNSLPLIASITEEAAYGQKMLEVVQGHKKTSFAKTSRQQATTTQKLTEGLAALEAQEVKVTTAELTDEDIADIDIEVAPVAEPTQDKVVADAAAKLSTLTPGSPEYTQALNDLQVANDSLAQGKPDTVAEEAPTVTEETVEDEQPVEDDTTVRDEVTEPAEVVEEEQPKSFVELSLEAFPKAASAVTETLAGIAGKIFPDLIKIQEVPGIHTVPDAAFKKESTLIAALVELGVTPKSAEILAEEFTGYEKAYNALVLDEVFEKGSFAIRQPLSMLYRDGDGKVPPQVLFAMMTNTLGWVQQNPKNDALIGNSQRERFLYGSQGGNITWDEQEQLEGLGHPYKSVANSIGANIARMLKISAKDTESSIYYDNLVTALGMAALEAGQGTGAFTVENKRWKFDEANKEGRTFNNGEEFRHIVMDETIEQVETLDGQTYDAVTGVTFSDEQNAAIDEVITALNEDADIDGITPLQEPAKDVINNIRNSFGGVPKKVKKTLRKLQNVEWTTSNSMDTFSKLAESHKGVLHALAGVVPVDKKNDHESTQISLNASNSDKTRTIDAVLAANKEGQLKKFFFKYSLMNQHRIMMQGPINPQSSHITRHLVKSFKATTYSKKNIHMFKLAVAANLGFKVDKNVPTNIANGFDQYMQDDVILAAVKAMQEGDMDALAPLLIRVKSRFGGDISILSAISALASYIPYHNGDAESFSSDIAMEIDGVTNGFAMNILQFPLFGDAGMLERVLNQTGTYFGKTAAETTHLESGVFKDAEALDVYLDLGARVRAAADVGTATDYYSTDEDFSAETYEAQSAALSELYFPLADLTARDLVKYPFMIFQYGGGVTSISEGVAGDIVADLYVQMSRLQKTYKMAPFSDTGREQFLENTVKPFNELLRTVGANVDVVSAVRNGKVHKLFLNDTVLTAEIGRTLAPRFDKGLSEMLGDTKEARDAVVQAGEVMHALFMQHYDKAYAEKKDAVGRELSTRERSELVREKLIKLLPQYRGPLMEADDSAFVDLSKQATDTGASKGVDTVEFAYNDGTGKKKLRTSEPTRKEFIAPGVSALIRTIINMDSALMTLSLDANPEVLTLFDAFMGSPEDLAKISKLYGKDYLRLGRETSVMQSMQEQMHSIIDETRRLDEENDTDLLDSANAWLEENAFSGTDKQPMDLEAATVVVDEAAVTVAAAREELFSQFDDRGGVSHQMHIAEMSSTNPDALSAHDATEGDRTDAMQELKDELHSLDDLVKENVVEKTAGDISSGNIRKLFKRFKDISRSHYASDAQMEAHSSVLENVINILAKGIDNTNKIGLTVEQIDGVTQGSYRLSRNKMKISLSRQAPASANSQSAQEVYVHELLHATTTHALNTTPLVAKQVRRLYAQVKRELDSNGGYRVFLANIDGTPSAADIEMAKKQYNYLFKNPKNETNKLAEFLAYATTNKALVQYLQGTTTKLPVRDKSLMGKLQHIVDVVIDAFVRAMRKGTGANAHQDMLAVLDQLIGIQNKHEGIYTQIAQKLVKKSDAYDVKIRDIASRAAVRLISETGTNKLRKVTNAVIGATAIHMSSNAVTAKVTRRVHGMLGTTLRSLASELGEGVLTKDLVKQLLVVKNKISKARQEVERDSLTWFGDIWKSVDPDNISAETKVALTNVLLRTDLSSLVDVTSQGKRIMSHAQVAKLLGDPRLIDVEIRKILRQLGLNTGHRAIQYAAELGMHIATGNTALHNGHSNVHTIANDELLDASPDTIQYLDAYTSLIALKNADSRQQTLIKQLSDEEFAADAKQNAIIDILDYHLEFTQASKAELFGGNPFQTYKGWVVERVDNLTSMQTGTLADMQDMKKAGYIESFALGKIPGVPQAHDTLYVSRNMPEVPYVSGIMSVTSQRSMGTNLTDILAKDPANINADGSTNYSKIRKDIRLIAKRENAGAKSLRAAEGHKLRPIRDDRGNITDYRIMMNHSTKAELLRPDIEFQNVFAHMQSSFIDKTNTITSDKDTIDLLVHEQANLMPMLTERFINIMDPKSPFHDRYARMPREVRRYMDQFVVNGEFMVREDIVDKVFGFTVWDASNLKFLQKPSRARMRWGVRMAHYMVKSTVSYGMDRIVIGTSNVVAGNLMSNLFQLSMRKISPVYTVSKMYEGYQEYLAYQKDADRLRKLNREIRAKDLGTSSPEAAETVQIRTRMGNNKINRMSVAGLNSLIVEDLNEASNTGYISRMQKTLKAEKYTKFTDKVPNILGTAAKTLFMTRTSAPYRFAKQIVQLSDFLARYVMIEHATTVKGVDFDTAMHDAVNAFVLFDENMTPALEALNSVAGTLFASYWMRNQRAAKGLIKNSPTAVLTAAGIQYVTDIDTLANINSSFYGMDFSPSILQLDDVIGKVTDATLLSNLGVEIL